MASAGGSQKTHGVVMLPGPSSPLVSIVIVNYNGADFIAHCLRSVFAQTYRPIEVIVVDNASTDASVELVERTFPEVRIVRSEKNRGFAGGNNVGVQAASADYIVLLNNDATVEEGWLSPLIEAIEVPSVAVVTSKVITDGIPDAFYEMNGTINYLGQNIMRQFADLSQVFYAGGTSLIFKKSLVGIPFLDELFLYHEDVYLSWKWRLRGYDAMMAQRSLVYHRGNATSKREASALITFYRERNRVLNLLLFFERATLIKLVPFLLLDCFLKIANAMFSKSKSLRGVLDAYWWLCSHQRHIARLRAMEQAERVIADAEIMTKMSAAMFDEARSPRILRVANAFARMYATLTGLRFHTPVRTE